VRSGYPHQCRAVGDLAYADRSVGAHPCPMQYLLLNYCPGGEALDLAPPPGIYCCT
jgi:hypothetical protein